MAPIILFVYNRPLHTRKVVEALLDNSLSSDSDLFIYADGPRENCSADCRKNISEVRQYIHSIEGFRSIHIIEQTVNKGLDPSEIDAVTEIVNRYGRVIVLEDDIVVSPYFLQFMNDALEYYKDWENVFQIGSFVPVLRYIQQLSEGTYFSYRSESWGWATWKEKWNLCDYSNYCLSLNEHSARLKQLHYNRAGADMYDNLLSYLKGQNDAWDARWQDCMYRYNAVCVRPTRTLSINIGFDGTGEHCGIMSEEDKLKWATCLYDQPIILSDRAKKANRRGLKGNVPIRLIIEMYRFYAHDQTPYLVRLKRLCKRYFNRIL